MNFLLIMSMVILTVTAHSPSMIFNTKSVNSEGKDVCSWNNVQILPLNKLSLPGKCQELFCDQDFTINISNCFVDPSGKCQWVGGDNSEPYPDCCGIRICS